VTISFACWRIIQDCPDCGCCCVFIRIVRRSTQFSDKLTDDPVFGFMYPLGVEDFFDGSLLKQQQTRLENAAGLSFIVDGRCAGAPKPALLLHAGVARWEIQQRQRAHRIGNLGQNNAEDSPSSSIRPHSLSTGAPPIVCVTSSTRMSISFSI